MKLFLNIIAITIIGLQIQALELNAPIAPVSLSDQFEKPLQITNDTKLVLFVTEKKPASLLTDYVTEANLDLAAKNIVIVSDISKMPSLITSMFAIPAMKKYKFKIALDSTGDETKTWPKEKGQIAAIYLDQLKVTKIQYLKTKEELVGLLK